MKIENQIANLSLEELLALNRQIVEQIKSKRFIERVNAIGNFRVNMKVRVKGSQRLGDSVGTIKEIKRVKADVDFGIKGIWTVPANMLEKV
jgi:hypothetical protein